MHNVATNTKNGITYRGCLSESVYASERVIIHIHGMASSYTDHNLYPVMHDYYPSRGVSFLVVEHSGSGPAGTAREKFENCVGDIQTWVDFVTEHGYKEVWLQSHSLGTPKVAYYMDQAKPKNIAGLIFLSPSEMIGLVHDPVGQIDYDHMYPEAVKLVSEGKHDEILKHKLWESVELSAGTFLNFFGDGANTAVFNYADPSLGWGVVNRLSVPVLAITGTKDDGISTVMNTNDAMKMLKSELTSSPRVQTIVYENAEHDFVGYENKIVCDVISFISTKSNL